MQCTACMQHHARGFAVKTSDSVPYGLRYALRSERARNQEQQVSRKLAELKKPQRNQGNSFQGMQHNLCAGWRRSQSRRAPGGAAEAAEQKA